MLEKPGGGRPRRSAGLLRRVATAEQRGAPPTVSRPAGSTRAADEVARVAAAAPDQAVAGRGRLPAWPARSSPPPGSTSSSGTCPAGGRGCAGRRGSRARPRTRRAGPFVGQAGRCSTSCWPRPGSPRADAAVVNVVKCRPPGNRTPKAAEVARCSGWLQRQLELLDPPVVVALGLSVGEVGPGPAHRALGAGARPRRTTSAAARSCATYHPSAAHPLRPERRAPGGARRRPRRAVARPSTAGVRPRARAARRRRGHAGRWAATLAGLLRAGDLVVLVGPLGAGKTALTQGIGAGLGVRGPVTSPTFVIARVHPSRRAGLPLVHVDAYRLGGALDVDDLDLDASLDDVGDRRRVGGGAGRAARRRAARGAACDRRDDDVRVAQPRPHGPGLVGPRWAGVDLRRRSPLACPSCCVLALDTATPALSPPARWPTTAEVLAERAVPWARAARRAPRARVPQVLADGRRRPRRPDRRRRRLGPGAVHRAAGRGRHRRDDADAAGPARSSGSARWTRSARRARGHRGGPFAWHRRAAQGGLLGALRRRRAPGRGPGGRPARRRGRGWPVRRRRPVRRSARRRRCTRGDVTTRGRCPPPPPARWSWPARPRAARRRSTCAVPTPSRRRRARPCSP